MVMAVGWLSGTMVVPAVGYLLHVDTDYLRFGFFLPVAFLPLIVVSIDRAATLLPSSSPTSAASEPESRPAPTTAPGLSGLRARPASQSALLIHVAVLLVVALVAFDYGIPVAASSERVNTQNAHDTAFLDAISFLRQNHVPGAVLTYDGATRWVEALTARAAFDAAPTWELFYPWQIIDGQESYFALNSRYTITDNHVALMYTGLSVPSLSGQPLYSVLVEGIQLPVLRITPAATFVNATHNGVEQRYSVGNLGSPLLEIQGGATPSVTSSFSGPLFYYNETDQIVGGGGTFVNVTVTPTPGSGTTIDSFSYGFAAPSGSDPILHGGKTAGISFSGATFTWQLGSKLGQIPGTYVVTTNGAFAVAPTSIDLPSEGVPNLMVFTFGSNTTPTSTSSLELSTAGTGNPAVQLPAVLDTAQFLTSNDIRFVLIPNNPVYVPTLQLFETQLGFQSAYENSEWAVLEG
jgi:hypothetical protein